MGLYEQPREISDLAECFFYHTTEIPGYGVVDGEWDLRRGINAYLGNVDFAGKRVLEVGTASGFVCFHMERKGADVVAFDLSDRQAWDVVPYARYDSTAFLRSHMDHIRRVNNAFWLCHRVFESHSRVVYGDVYSIPDEIGPVDITTVCSVLLHLRDPFLALQRAVRLARETVIVTEPAGLLAFRHIYSSIRRLLPRQLTAPSMTFQPDSRVLAPKDAWWRFSPDTIQRFLAVLGFEDSSVTYHYQLGRLVSGTQTTRSNLSRTKFPLKQFTVVARRTVPSGAI